MTLAHVGLTLAALAADTGRTGLRLGLEGLLTDSLHLVSGHRVGIVTNHAAVDRNGVSVVDRLRAGGVELVAIFSPEHGFRGTAAPGEAVASTVDSVTGLPIYSLYGRNSAPTDSMLQGVEVLLVDLPDAGTRYFTYLATTVDVMRAATRRRLPVVVLDRPNPLGGRVQGNVLGSSHRSAIGLLEVPMRHGLTLGELARLANGDLGIGADLTVVPVTGWRRSEDAITTRLPFIPPSPNLTDLESLFHYPGTCLFEGTALSVGRGTDAGFRQIGAPWLDPEKIIAMVERARPRPAGVRFRAVEFTPLKPGDGKFDGVKLRGIRLELTNRAIYDPVAVGIELLEAIRRSYPDSIALNQAHFDRLAGGIELREAILADRSPSAIIGSWKPGVRRFLARRAPILLYR